MIGGKLFGTVVLAVYSLVGIASSQLMVCFHRDGKSQVEFAAFQCCETTSETKAESCEDACSTSPSPACPDDQCKDLPLTSVAPQVTVAVEAPGSSIVVTEILSVVPINALSDARTVDERGGFPTSRDHPPESGAREHLRTVILRL